MTFSKRLILSSLLILLPLASHAQVEIIKTELLTLSFNGSIPGYFYRHGKDVRKLLASRQGISPPIYYVGPRILALYKNKSDLDPVEEGEVPPKPLLSVEILKDTDRTLLVFAFTPENKEVPLCKAYGIKDELLKAGDYRIFNFSKQNIYVIFNDMKSAVKSGKHADLKASKLGRKVQDMNVKFGAQKGGGVRPAYSSVWGYRPERRSFIFVFDRSNKRRPLAIKKFYDVPSFKARRSK